MRIPGITALSILLSLSFIFFVSVLQSRAHSPCDGLLQPVPAQSWGELFVSLRESPSQELLEEASYRIKKNTNLSDLASMSWVPIMDALDATHAYSIFEQIVRKRLEYDRSGTLIRFAGNAEDDAIRIRYLLKLREYSLKEKVHIAGLDELIGEIERWRNPARGLPGGEGSMSYFHRDVARNLDYNLHVPEDSPLYPIGCIYRANMLVRATLQSGSIISYPDIRRRFLDKAQRLFRLARAAFPENRIVRMNMGEPYPPVKIYPVPPEAPEWAVSQREALERLTDIIEWWIDNRLNENGEYGGGWGDDCEMWRNWVAVLLGFESPKIIWAQSFFSEALLSQPHLEGGYMSGRMTDVEHSAEDLSDALTPMRFLKPDNPEWKSRALRLADLMEHLWTGINERGFLQFKSTYFTAFDVESDTVKACDSIYHPKSVQPLLLYWLRTRDERLTRLFSRWMDTWVDAAARSERGKPAGILPSAIHWPRGYAGGTGKNWWDPRNHPGEVTLYQFPSAMHMITSTLLETYYITGNEKYLAPLRSMAEIRMEYLENPVFNPPPGSKEWCGARIGFIAQTAAKYRLLTGESDFDDLLQQNRSSYMYYRLSGDSEFLTEKLAHTAEALRNNIPGYTSEVRYTDRVFRFPALFAENMMFRHAIPAMKSPDLQFLYSAVTGDPGSPGFLPLNTVKWLTGPREIAALVTDTGEDLFTALLFHFGKSTRDMGAEFYLLNPGTYRYRLSDTLDGEELDSGRFINTTSGGSIHFPLPSRRQCILSINKI